MYITIVSVCFQNKRNYTGKYMSHLIHLSLFFLGFEDGSKERISNHRQSCIVLDIKFIGKLQRKQNTEQKRKR